MQDFLLLGLPYAAIAMCVFGSIWRFRKQRFSYSALSSQFLEDKWLLWGSIPWHIGVLVLFVGHVLALCLPGLWAGLTTNTAFLYTVEAVGVGAAILAIVGLVVLGWRRLVHGRVQAVTTTLDLAVLGLLLVQVLLGLMTAIKYPWGAQWSTGTVAPYILGLFTLSPDASLVAEMPPLMRAHLALAWVIVALVPFSRLIHVFSLPIAYLWRAPQLVVWANARRFQANPDLERNEETRRHFLRGAISLAAGLVLLAAGTADKLGRFFMGPRLDDEQEGELMEKKLARLRRTTREKELELERLRQDYIRIARVGELGDKKGRYFIDYKMRPALAFRDASGLPNLISAKCTHLGCTVGSETDGQGRILCPCHVSYFDIETGEPNAGAPATEPLPHLGWVLMDSSGEIVATQSPDGTMQGSIEGHDLDALDVFIARNQEGQGS